MMRYLLLFLCILPFLAKAQDYSGMVEDQKFDKAWKKCQKVLKKNPESLEEVYFSALIQSRILAGDLFNPIEAQEKYKKAQQLYKEITDVKKLEKLDEIPINLKAFRSLNDSISRGGLIQAKILNTEQGYIDYLNMFPSSSDLDKQYAILERNRLAFILAKTNNTEISYQGFIDKYPGAIEVKEAKNLRNQVAFSTAIALNSIEGYDDFLRKYPEAGERNLALSKRNALAFMQAKEKNTIEAFEYFIQKYPDAVEVLDAQKFIIELSYEEAKMINTVVAFQEFIEKFTNSNFSSTAKDRIHELAFEIAKKNNDSKAYLAFAENYPESKQKNDAYQLFQLRRYEENTDSSSWESFKFFIENFDGPYTVYALNNLCEFARGGDFECLKYLCGLGYNPDLVYNKNELVLSAFQQVRFSGEKSDLDILMKDFGSYLNVEDFLILKEDIKRSEEAEKLHFELPFNSADQTNYIEYIKNNGYTDLAFVALQRLVSGHLTKSEYGAAIKQIENLEGFFTRNLDKIDQLKGIISKAADTKIHPVSLTEINTIGNEYSPVISADNNSIYFCGNDRMDNFSGEDIFVLKSSDKKIPNIRRIEEFSKSNSNEAPICISSDGNDLYLFSNGKIFKSSKDVDGWEIEDSMHVINTDFWQGDATISSDNQTLIFARGSKNLDVINDPIYNEKSVISVKTKITKESLVNKYLLGEGITANKISLSKDDHSYGVFEGGLKAGLPFDSGIMLSTGNVKNSAVFNEIGDTGSQNFNNDKLNLQQLVPNAELFDATELKFDFVSISDTMSFNYIFGSEEYPEFVCSEFNDVFGFFLSGPNPNGGYYKNENIAKLPNSNIFVSINTINNGVIGANGNVLNCDLIDPRWRDLSVYFNENEYSQYGWGIDGFTDNLKTGAKLIPGERYTISIAIADVSDNIYDSYVILEKNSFSGVTLISNKNTFNKYHGDFLPKSDLYISHKNIYGEWQKPERMTSTINTIYTERSPFLHPDLKTLYFSSDGHGGLGKLDVFVSKRLSDTCWNCWSEPVNLGKEINSPNSDWGYKISTDGQYAYFSKDSKSKSREDIYKIMLPSHLRPDYVAKIEGELKNSKNEPIATTIRWEDLEADKVIGIAKTDPSDGSYFIALPLGKNYGYYVEDTTYFPVSNNLDLRNVTTQIEVNNNIQVITFQEMIDQGIAVSMNNLFFAFGKYFVLPASYPELKRIAKIIERYDLKVEIDGHTDDVGNDESNLILSDKRAAAVKEYLVRIGCKEEMLITHGYGESKPLYPNDNDANRAKNRRVELRLIK